MSADGSTRRSMVWTLVGRAAGASAQAGLLVLLARVGSARMVGELALAMALCSPVMVIAGLQLRVVYATDVAQRFAWSSYRHLRASASAVGVAIACMLAASPWIDVSLGIIAAVALTKAGELASDLHFGVFQRRGHMRLYGRSLILRASGGLAALTGVLIVTDDLATALLASAAVTWMVAWLHDAPHAKALRVHSGNGLRASTGALLRTAAPLGLVTFIDSMTQHIVRLQVDAALDTTALGQYAAMSYIVVAGGAVVFSLGTPLLPRMAEHFEAGRRLAFRAIAGRLVLSTAALGLAGIVFAQVLGTPFLRWTFGPEFAREGSVFVWVMAAGALHFILGALVHVLNAAKQRRAQLWIYLGALSGAVATAWICIPINGLRGAAQASMVGWALAVCAASVVLMRAYVMMPPEDIS